MDYLTGSQVLTHTHIHTCLESWSETLWSIVNTFPIPQAPVATKEHQLMAALQRPSHNLLRSDHFYLLFVPTHTRAKAVCKIKPRGNDKKRQAMQFGRQQCSCRQRDKGRGKAAERTTSTRPKKTENFLLSLLLFFFFPPKSYFFQLDEFCSKDCNGHSRILESQPALKNPVRPWPCPCSNQPTNQAPALSSSFFIFALTLFFAWLVGGVSQPCGPRGSRGPWALSGS